MIQVAKLHAVRIVSFAALCSCAVPGAFAQEGTDWTGFYAGIHGGYAIGTSTATNGSLVYEETDDTDGDGIDDVLEATSYLVEVGRIEGAHGGLHLGYLQQTGNIVFGGKAAVTLGALSQSQLTRLDYSETDIATGALLDEQWLEASVDHSISWMTSVNGQLGYALDNHLIYLTAGVALADFNTKQSIESSPAAPGVGALPNINGTINEIKVGGVIGLGWQTKLTDAISFGAEYTYTHFGDSVVASAFGGEQTYENRFHAVKASLNYHF